MRRFLSSPLSSRLSSSLLSHARVSPTSFISHSHISTSLLCQVRPHTLPHLASFLSTSSHSSVRLFTEAPTTPISHVPSTSATTPSATTATSSSPDLKVAATPYTRYLPASLRARIPQAKRGVSRFFQSWGIVFIFLAFVYNQLDDDYRQELLDELYAYYYPFKHYQFNHTHGQRKLLLFTTLKGNVLELFPEGGSNFAYYQKALTRQTFHGQQISMYGAEIVGLTKWTGIDTNNKPWNDNQLLPNAAVHHGDLQPNTTMNMIEVKRKADVLDQLNTLPAETYDAIVATQSLYQFDTHEWQQQVLPNIHRLLKPGGRFFFVVENNERNSSDFVSHSLQNLKYQFSRALSFLIGDTYRPVPLAQMMTQSNFQDVYMESWPHYVKKTNSRIGITAVQSTQQQIADVVPVQDISQVEVTGLRGLHPIVAGVATKKA